MNVLLTFLLGIILRLGIPIAITALLLFLLSRMDKRWQKEAMALPVIADRKPCWEIKGCPEEKKKNCKAFSQQDTPCWQVFRNKDGVLKEACLGCEVFLQAPMPVQA